MPKEIITNGAFRKGNPWIQVGWSRDTYVQVGVLTEAQAPPPNPGVPSKKGALRPSPEVATEGAALFADLDREGINKMIRALRKARDQAYGSDA